MEAKDQKRPCIAKRTINSKQMLYAIFFNSGGQKKVREVQGMPQSQTAALPRPQEEVETDKSKQSQIEQTYEKL